MKNAPIITLLTVTVIFALSSPAMALSPYGAQKSPGEKLFKSKCGGCHSVDKHTIVGPGLKGITERKSDEWITAIMLDPQGTWTSDHPETRELKERLFAMEREKTKMKVRVKKGQAAKILEYLHTL